MTPPPVKKVIKVRKDPANAPPVHGKVRGGNGTTPQPTTPPVQKPIRKPSFLGKCLRIVVQDIKNLPSRIIWGKKKKPAGYDPNYDPLSAAHEKSKRGW